jgi:hypothetical protein
MDLRPIYRASLQRLGTSQAELGRALAERWGTQPRTVAKRIAEWDGKVPHRDLSAAQIVDLLVELELEIVPAEGRAGPLAGAVAAAVTVWAREAHDVPGEALARLLDVLQLEVRPRVVGP